MVQVDLCQCTVKLIVHLLCCHSKVLSPGLTDYAFNLIGQSLHGVSSLKLLNFVKDLVTQRLCHIADEVEHFLLRIYLVIDVEVQIWILEHLSILRLKALLEVRNEVWMLQVLAHMRVSLDDQLVKGYFRWKARILLIVKADLFDLAGLESDIICEEVVLDDIGGERLLDTESYRLWTCIFMGEVV